MKASLDFRYRRTPGRLLALVIGALALVAFGGGSASANVIAGPQFFKDDREGVMASDGKNLWLAVTGSVKKGSLTRVAMLRGSRWIPVGGPLATDYHTELVIRRGKSGRPEPCLGRVAPGQRPAIDCRSKGRWHRLSVPAPLSKMTFYGMHRVGGNILVLFRQEKRLRPRGITVSQIRLARIDGNRLTPLAARIDRTGTWLPGFVPAVGGRPKHQIELDLMNLNKGVRIVASRAGSGWSYSKPLASVALLTNRSTPAIRQGDELVAPLSQLWDETTGYGGRQETVGAFSLQRLDDGSWTRVGDQLETGFGVPQGGFYPVGDQIWALWQENSYEGIAFGGALRTRVFAARVTPKATGFDQQMTLWTGRAYFPVQLGAIEHRGRPVFLYQRQVAPRRGLRTFIDIQPQPAP